MRKPQPKKVVARYLHRAAQGFPIVKGKPRANFYGENDGYWMMTTEYLIGADRREWDWSAISGMGKRNNWQTLVVDGATEHHRGFLKALREMVRKYPQLLNWEIQFDGPWLSISDLVGKKKTRAVDWKSMRFLHGTSSAVGDSILEGGLQPRSMSGTAPSYGAGKTTAGNPNAVYLTTQTNMAKMAALDAGKALGGDPIVFEVWDLDPSLVGPDEDSGATTAEESLARLGSIAYYGVLRQLRYKMYRQNGKWVTL